MSIFNFKKQNQEYLIPPQKVEELQLVLKDANKYLIQSSNFPQEVQILTTPREIKHLKKQIWRFSQKY